MNLNYLKFYSNLEINLENKQLPFLYKIKVLKLYNLPQNLLLTGLSPPGPLNEVNLVGGAC